METFQIAKYGLMPVAALVYGMLVSGTVVKLGKPMADAGLPMPDGYYRALFFRDDGTYFLTLVNVWTIAASYLSSSLSRWNFGEGDLAPSGPAFSILLAVIGTFFACGGLIPLLNTGPTGMQ
jgi:hypothetical protein